MNEPRKQNRQKNEVDLSDDEITPKQKEAMLQRKSNAKTHKKMQQVEDEWFVQSGDKIIRKFKKANGNVHSVYIGLKKKVLKDDPNFIKNNASKFRVG